MIRHLAPCLAPCLALCLALGLAPQAGAQGFDGIYEFGLCSPPPGEVALVVSGQSLTRYDTTCTLAHPKPMASPPGAIAYRLTCDWGRGPETLDAALWYNVDGDLILRIAEVEERYVRCTGR
jgi:hypothetical protein